MTPTAAAARDREIWRSSSCLDGHSHISALSSSLVLNSREVLGRMSVRIVLTKNQGIQGIPVSVESIIHGMGKYTCKG